MATVNASGAYVKVRSGKPSTDLKGYPRTDGLPVPVLVRGAVLAPPAGLALIGGRWLGAIAASAAPGTLSVTGDVNAILTIADSDLSGTNVAALVQALTPGEMVWTSDAFNNTWSGTIDSVVDGAGVTTITVSAETGVFQVGEVLRFAAGTPT
jgi:hypothetical protein